MRTEDYQKLRKSLASYTAKTRGQLQLEEAGAVSYLGLWLLLALYGDGLKNPGARELLTDVLDLNLRQAKKVAEKFLASVEDQRKNRPDYDKESGFSVAARAFGDRGCEHLKVDLEPIPSQEVFNSWIDEATLGIIKEFPLPEGGDLLMFLVSALGIKAPWEDDMDKLDDSTAVLYDGSARYMGIFHSKAAGEVVVLSPRGPGHVEVLTVAAHPDVPAESVWKAVDEITEAMEEGPLQLKLITPEDEGWCWTVKELEGYSTRPLIRQTKLPLWTRAESHELTKAPGVRFFATPDVEVEAMQEAIVEYTASGYSAAAVTIMSFRASSAMAGHPRFKLVEFDLTHGPQAVVALWSPSNGAEKLPVFSSWIHPGDVDAMAVVPSPKAVTLAI